MRCFFTISLLFLLASSSYSAPKTLSGFKTVYEESITKIEEKHQQKIDAIIKLYDNHLDTQIEAARNKGDLDGYTKLKAEKKRLASEQTIPSGSPITKKIEKAQTGKYAEISDLSKKYVKALTKRKISLVKKEQIDEALTVDKEIKRVEFVLASMASQLPQPKHPKPELPKPKPAAIKRTLVLWNQHNGSYQNCGTRTVDVQLSAKGKVVHEQKSVEVDWKKNADVATTLTLPAADFDRVRIEITDWHDVAGGFAEVQIFEGTKNIAPRCKVTASSSYDKKRAPDKVIDGNTSSSKASVGYWLLPANVAGWIEFALPKK